MNPLVSIMIPNFNHARFIDQCIQSAISQTYKDLEIMVLDNASTDNSVEVASKYLDDPRVSVCRNQFNIINANYNALDQLTSGKYKLLLCADDYIQPDFVRQAVEIMEKYPNVGYVHGERDFVTEDGQVLELDPFYKCSFVAPGRSTMPIYMMTTVAHPSQGIFRASAFHDIDGYDKEIDHMNADKVLWFYLSYENDAAYIRDKMCGIRIGAQTETFITQQNFQHPILCHLTINDFAKFAREKGIPEVYSREARALESLSHEFVGYAIGMLAVEDFVSAQSYLTYAKVVSRKILQDEEYQTAASMIKNGKTDKEQLKRFVKPVEEKKRNYDPPEGYTKIEF